MAVWQSYVSLPGGPEPNDESSPWLVVALLIGLLAGWRTVWWLLVVGHVLTVGLLVMLSTGGFDAIQMLGVTVLGLTLLLSRTTRDHTRPGSRTPSQIAKDRVELVGHRA